jgi:hypothetical protein
MRAARPTISSIVTDRGAGLPHPALRATLSRRERAVQENRSRILECHWNLHPVWVSGELIGVFRTGLVYDRVF